MTRTSIVIVTICTILFILPATSQSGYTPPPSQMSVAELRNKFSDTLREYDTDDDGQLTAAEVGDAVTDYGKSSLSQRKLSAVQEVHEREILFTPQKELGYSSPFQLDEGESYTLPNPEVRDLSLEVAMNNRTHATLSVDESETTFKSLNRTSRGYVTRGANQPAWRGQSVIWKGEETVVMAGKCGENQFFFNNVSRQLSPELQDDEKPTAYKLAVDYSQQPWKFCSDNFAVTGYNSDGSVIGSDDSGGSGEQEVEGSTDYGFDCEDYQTTENEVKFCNRKIARQIQAGDRSIQLEFLFSSNDRAGDPEVPEATFIESEGETEVLEPGNGEEQIEINGYRITAPRVAGSNTETNEDDAALVRIVDRSERETGSQEGDQEEANDGGQRGNNNDQTFENLEFPTVFGVAKTQINQNPQNTNLKIILEPEFPTTNEWHDRMIIKRVQENGETRKTTNNPGAPTEFLDLSVEVCNMDEDSIEAADVAVTRNSNTEPCVETGLESREEDSTGGQTTGSQDNQFYNGLELFSTAVTNNKGQEQFNERRVSVSPDSESYSIQASVSNNRMESSELTLEVKQDSKTLVSESGIISADTSTTFMSNIPRDNLEFDDGSANIKIQFAGTSLSVTKVLELEKPEYEGTPVGLGQKVAVETGDSLTFKNSQLNILQLQDNPLVAVSTGDGSPGTITFEDQAEELRFQDGTHYIQGCSYTEETTKAEIVISETNDINCEQAPDDTPQPGSDTGSNSIFLETEDPTTSSSVAVAASVTDSLDSKGYEIEVTGPDGFSLSRQQSSVSFDPGSSGRYTAKLYPLTFANGLPFVEDLVQSAAKAETSFEVSRADSSAWIEYCNGNGYDIESLDQNLDAAASCVGQEIVPAFFVQGGEGQDTRVPESLCQEVLGTMYMENQRACGTPGTA